MLVFHLFLTFTISFVSLKNLGMRHILKQLFQQTKTLCLIFRLIIILVTQLQTVFSTVLTVSTDPLPISVQIDLSSSEWLKVNDPSSLITDVYSIQCTQTQPSYLIATSCTPPPSVLYCCYSLMQYILMYCTS